MIDEDKVVYYSFCDITLAYDIPEDKLKRLVRSGKIHAIKVWRNTYPRNWYDDEIIFPRTCFHWAIPSSEIPKIKAKKIGELTYCEQSQPEYWDNRREQERQRHEQFKREQEQRDKHQERMRIMDEQWKQQHGGLTYVTYYDYIQSDEWKKVKAKRLNMDGYKCKLCGTAKNLQCHHVSYEHLGKPDEIDDVITLCRECHRKVHDVDLRKEKTSE